MKKNLTIIAMSVIAVFGIAACNNNQKPAEETVAADTVVTEENIAEAAPVETAVAVAEEPVKDQKADNKVVKAAKKAQSEVKEVTDEAVQTVKATSDAATQTVTTLNNAAKAIDNTTKVTAQELQSTKPAEKKGRKK